MFALEIQLLTGAYRAEVPDHSQAEWPPHPERVFSALAQSWGDGGCDIKERAALEWLESLAPPLIEADHPDECAERSAPIVYVPPNDMRGDELNVLLEHRKRQARNFRACVPSSPIVRLVWTDTSCDRHKPALDTLAARVASLGHSSSLVRFEIRAEAALDESRLWRPGEGGTIALRAPRAGRLRNLERWLMDGRRPLVADWCAYHRPGAPKDVMPSSSTFGGESDWFVFEEAGGMRPDLLAFAHVAKCVRMALLKHADQPPAEVISGHTSDGSASRKQHVAILPLANLGWEHATGDLLGFAVVLPRGIDGADRGSVLAAIARFARIEEGNDSCAELHLASDFTWRVQRSAVPSRASLRSARWCAASASWASATPVILDRFADDNDPVEEARYIAAGCHNIGLPEPEEVEIHKHSTVRGAPSAYAASAARSSLDWSFPEGAKFARRPRRHVVLRFAAPVRGPVILGAGRYYGFGLCLPLDQER